MEDVGNAVIHEPGCVPSGAGLQMQVCVAHILFLSRGEGSCASELPWKQRFLQSFAHQVKT